MGWEGVGLLAVLIGLLMIQRKFFALTPEETTRVYKKMNESKPKNHALLDFIGILTGCIAIAAIIALATGHMVVFFPLGAFILLLVAIPKLLKR